jgi:putative transposase
MPRMPRLTLAGQAHHVIQRGNNRQAIFFCDADRRFFLSQLAEALVAHGCELHAYVLMTNHIHLLMTPGRDDAIGRLMQSLGRRYVGYINRNYARTGTLWEGRFKSTIVDAEDYVMACYRYIEANPLRARMVARADDHAWSSYGANAGGRREPMLTPHGVYLSLGATPKDRQAAYRDTFAEGLSDDLVQTLRDATQRGWVPGSERFQKHIAAVLGRRVAPPVRGRPRKAEEGKALSPDIDQPSLC